MAASIKGTPNTSTTTSVTIPTHAVGDDIYIFAYRDGSTTVPSKPSASGTVPAWSDIESSAGANTNSLRLAHFVATATNHTSGTWTNATGMIAVVVQGQAASPIGGHAQGGGTSSTSATAPAITQQQTTGKALILEFYGHRTVTAWSSAPANYTRQASNATEVCLNSKNSSTSDGSIAQSCTTSASSGYRAATLEILSPETSPTVSLNTPNDAATGQSTTPTLNFTGTDGESDAVEYNVQVHTDNAFDTQSNNAISLNGSGQYGTISSFTGLNNINGTYTVEGWFLNDSTSSAYSTAWRVRNGDAYRGALTTENGTGNTGCNFSTSYDGATDADGYVASGVFTQNTWVHVAVVATLNSVSKVYVNGVEVGSYNLQNTPAGNFLSWSGCAFNLGHDPSSTPDPDWKGKIGGFLRVWNTTRSAAQLLANKSNQIASDANLIINLKFMEGSGTVVDNAATAGADLNLTGTPSWTTGPSITGNSLIDTVSSSDAGFTAGHPFTSGAAKDYTVQSALANSTTYYWRVRAIDPTGSNTYGSFSSARSFTTVSSATTKTITGKARITASNTKTVLGKGRVTAVGSKTVLGKGRIGLVSTKTAQGKSRITKSTTKTVTGKSRVTATGTKTILGKSRIGLITPKTIQGKSRIGVTSTKTIAGKSRVTATGTKTVQGKSRLTATGTKTVTGKSQIRTTATKTVLGKSRVTVSAQKTIQGKSRVTSPATKTISGKSNILNISTKTVTGKANISATTSTSTKTVTGKGRIGLVSTKTVTGQSRVTAANIKTLLGKARIQKATLKTVQGVSNILIISSKTITGKSLISVVLSQSIEGKAKILLPSATKTITGKSHITANGRVSIKGKASILSNIAPPLPKLIYVDGNPAWHVFGKYYILL